MGDGKDTRYQGWTVRGSVKTPPARPRRALRHDGKTFVDTQGRRYWCHYGQHGDVCFSEYYLPEITWWPTPRMVWADADIAQSAKLPVTVVLS